MSNLLSSIEMLFKNGWKFFTQTDVPGTSISFAVFTVGLALIPVCFRFLSIMLGHNSGKRISPPLVVSMALPLALLAQAATAFRMAVKMM